MKIRTPAMVVVLTLGDNAVTGGYTVMDGYDEGGRQWRRLVSEAVRVDGGYENARALAKQRITLPVYIEGSTVADARAKHRALLDAVEATQWVLDVTGDGATALWVCDAADSEAPRFSIDGLKRVVTLSIPAQPAYGF